MLLENRVALITGAAGALGRAIAKAFQREGAVLALADLNGPAVVQTLEAVGQAGQGLALSLDISDAPACRQIVAAVVSRFGRLDILVNCAALCLVDAILEVTPERWDRVFDVNARGAFF